MVNCVLCIGNDGVVERGKLSDGTLFTINKITLKMSDGKRRRRYAVCVNGVWKSHEYMSWREALAKVRQMEKEAREAKYYAMYI